MWRQAWRWLIVAAIPAVWLVVRPPNSRAGRVECARVISAVNREVRLRRGEQADISAVAQRLGTTVTWVEQCMRTYGRRPRRPGLESAETREGLLEKLEEEEPEEQFPEDLAERGALQRIRPEKQRVLHPKPSPSPEFFEFFRHELQQ